MFECVVVDYVIIDIFFMTSRQYYAWSCLYESLRLRFHVLIATPFKLVRGFDI